MKMNDKVLGHYLKVIKTLMEEGKFIEAYKELNFVIVNYPFEKQSVLGGKDGRRKERRFNSTKGRKMKEIKVEGKQNTYIIAGDIMQIINKHRDDNPKRYLITLKDLPFLYKALMEYKYALGKQSALGGKDGSKN